MNLQRIVYTTVLAVIIMLSFLACGSGASEEEFPIQPDLNIGQLTFYSSCDELISDIKTSLVNKMEAQIDSHQCDNEYYYDDSDGVSVGTTADSASSESDSGSDYTGTNLQEDSVDEADLVKTDGEYIYTVTSDGIDIIKAWPVSAFGLVTTFEMDEVPVTLYLSENMLIAISENYNSNHSSVFTKISFIDVTNPENPTQILVKEIQGDYKSSRLVSGVLHVAVTSDLSFAYSIQYPDDFWEAHSSACYDYDSSYTYSENDFNQIIAQAKEDNRKEIETLDLNLVLPVTSDGETETQVDCVSIGSDNSDAETSLAGLYSIKLDDVMSQEKITYIKGRAHTIYASTSALYFAALDSEADGTYFHRFAIGSDELHSYFGSGGVYGQINNTFSMSEYNGSFRIATTVGHVSRDGNSDVYNNVYVIDAEDSSLPVIGSIENIAVGEKIYAARFFGDRGYLVTFEKVDPLFVIDVSDPEDPEIQGELKMPGYSTYLHQLDDDHIIGFGKETEEDSSGTFSWYQGLKLAVFDVEDGFSPSILDEEIIGSRGSDSYALYDHHAFTFDSNTGLLAIPLSLYEGGTGSDDMGSFQYNGVHVYDLFADGSIDVVAEIEVANSDCEVKRTIIMGEGNDRALFVLTDESIYVYDMNDDYALQKQAALSGDSYCSYWYY